MTDNEIKKALECCVSEQYTCGDCPYQEIKHYSDEGFEIMPNGKRYDDWSCERWLNVDLLDLINRLQAENERLTHITRNLIGEIKAEAMTEFAELLKNDWIGNLYYCEDLDIVDWVDNLLKEKVGEDNA